MSRTVFTSRPSARVATLLVAGLAAVAVSCTPNPENGGAASPTPTGATPTPTATASPTPTGTPKEMTLVRTLPHGGWSEGLDIHAGELWHAFPSTHQVFDPHTGEKKRQYTPPSEYSESLAWIRGELWNVSYSDSNLWIGTLNAGVFTWRIAGTTPEVHAWGITFDGEHVIVTGNGTPFLYFLDPDSGALVRTVETPIDDLEDLAWDGEAIWASSYTELRGQFFRLDRDTGDVLEVYALPESEVSGCQDQIVDGVAVEDGFLYVTGKKCPYIWVYELP